MNFVTTEDVKKYFVPPIEDYNDSQSDYCIVDNPQATTYQTGNLELTQTTLGAFESEPDEGCFDLPTQTGTDRYCTTDLELPTRGVLDPQDQIFEKPQKQKRKRCDRLNFDPSQQIEYGEPHFKQSYHDFLTHRLSTLPPGTHITDQAKTIMDQTGLTLESIQSQCVIQEDKVVRIIGPGSAYESTLERAAGYVSDYPTVVITDLEESALGYQGAYGFNWYVESPDRSLEIFVTGAYENSYSFVLDLDDPNGLERNCEE